ncbi:MAG TPA: hypothetical protein H9676_04265 [Firmicutes bacterium]|nr:hypothetical protein [Bacillota bacterium]
MNKEEQKRQKRKKKTEKEKRGRIKEVERSYGKKVKHGKSLFPGSKQHRPTAGPSQARLVCRRQYRGYVRPPMAARATGNQNETPPALPEEFSCKT